MENEHSRENPQKIVIPRIDLLKKFRYLKERYGSSKGLQVVVILMLCAVLPATVFLAQHEQDIRQHAADMMSDSGGGSGDSHDADKGRSGSGDVAHPGETANPGVGGGSSGPTGNTGNTGDTSSNGDYMGFSENNGHPHSGPSTSFDPYTGVTTVAGPNGISFQFDRAGNARVSFGPGVTETVANLAKNASQGGGTPLERAAWNAYPGAANAAPNPQNSNGQVVTYGGIDLIIGNSMVDSYSVGPGGVKTSISDTYARGAPGSNDIIKAYDGAISPGGRGTPSRSDGCSGLCAGQTPFGGTATSGQPTASQTSFAQGTSAGTTVSTTTSTYSTPTDGSTTRRLDGSTSTAIKLQ